MFIHPDLALELIVSQAPFTGIEPVDVWHSLNRVLAEDLLAPIDLPPFDKSAMDGFACREVHSGDQLKVLETIPAGQVPEKEIPCGHCSRIMTGAMIPAGADRVISIERVKDLGSTVVIDKPESRFNICHQGENARKGTPLLQKGTILRHQEIAVLSSFGLGEVRLGKLPMVGIISTGSELVPPGQPLKPGHVFDSNGPQLFNQVVSLPARARYYGIVSDDRDLISECISKALSECDLLLLSGGVSMGDYDFVPQVLKDLGVIIKVDQMAIKPGRPAIFGRRDHCCVFGLPGNPVSTFILFELFVKPLLFAMMGHTFKPLQITATLAQSIHRKTTDRVEFIPAHFDGEFATLVDYHGPGHLNSLCNANALIRMEQGVGVLEKGEKAGVRLI